MRSLHPSHWRWADGSGYDTGVSLSPGAQHTVGERLPLTKEDLYLKCPRVSKQRLSLYHVVPPLPVCNWPQLTDTCPVLTYSISGARVPGGPTVTPDRAKWQSNAAHSANLLAALQLSHREPLRKHVCPCVSSGDDVCWCYSFWGVRKRLSAWNKRASGHVRVFRDAGVKCQRGSARFTGSSWWMCLFPALSVPSILRRPDSRFCLVAKQDPDSMYLNQSHLSRLICSGQAEERRWRACWGTAGCWHLYL